MSDTREKLIQILRKKPYNMSEVSAGRLADHLLANGVTVQEWIPVTERLPKDTQATFVRTKQTGCETLVALYNSKDKRWEMFPPMTYLSPEFVTHWRPVGDLTEPQKGEKDNA